MTGSTTPHHDGRIPLCAHQSCGHTCCDFAEGNYIVLYPGEEMAARAAGKSLEHLEITPMAFGGHRAICHARDKAQCDGGYKPLDCASYPLFPTVATDGSIRAGLKGAKCPLRLGEIAKHQQWVVQQWLRLAAHRPQLLEWLRRLPLVGYERVT